MNKRGSGGRFAVPDGAGLHLDDIVPRANPSQQNDLSRLLFYVPWHRRPHVALAFLDLTHDEWYRSAGLEGATVRQWLRQDARMPLGGALRLAKVLGLSVDELFPGFC